MKDQEALIEEAKAAGLWLNCHDLWFPPEDLQNLNKAGRFRWGASNWTLRDPMERLAEIDAHISRVHAEREAFAARIAAATQVSG
jgi:hypothetical protein